MFSSISWEDFFSTAASITAGYYTITIILLYHKEIVQRFRSRGTAQALTLQPERTDDVIGPMSDEQPDERISVIDSDAVSVHQSDEEPDSISPAQAPGESLLVGSVADLLNEIKTIIRISAEYQTAKEECTELFKASILKYPHLKGTAYQDAIIGFICEECKGRFTFTLTIQEVQQWWQQ